MKSLEKKLTKTYTFTEQEMYAIRDALIDRKIHLTPGPDATEGRRLNHGIVSALAEQFKNDIRLLK